MTSMDAESFRRLLGGELERRQNRNASYSLRAFARSLDVDPSQLSKWMRGERPLTPQAVLRIGEKLGLSDRRLSWHLRRALDSSMNAGEVANGETTSETSWEEALIVESLEGRLAQLELSALSLALGLSEDAVREAFERLVARGWVGVDAEGRWVPQLPEADRAHLRAVAGRRGKILAEGLERCFEALLSGAGSGQALTLSLSPQAREELQKLFVSLGEKIQRLSDDSRGHPESEPHFVYLGLNSLVDSKGSC